MKSGHSDPSADQTSAVPKLFHLVSDKKIFAGSGIKAPFPALNL
jgi:hypothetical protein